MADIGDIYADVHANTDPFDPELRQGLDKAGRDADRLADNLGEKLGSTIADSMADELEKSGKKIGQAVEKGVERQKINIGGEIFSIDAKGRLHDSAGRFARNLGGDVAQNVAKGIAQSAGGAASGILGKAGQAMADAIGAGFNISGRSPLIALLIPAIGALVLAVFGAIQAINGLGAALVALPPLIAGIGAQIFVLTAAFDGVGEAMSNAFAATNAKELNEAIKDLTPSAQRFVKSMLPVRDMFNDLKDILQENFFREFGNSLAPMLRSLIEISTPGLARLATALGQLFAQLADFFDSKVFATFVTQILPATARWVQSFGPVFVDFLEALTRMATTAIPFLEKLGGLLNKVFVKVTNKIDEMVSDGSLAEWLDRMITTLEKVGAVFGSIINFIFSFIAAVDQAGGNKALDAIAEWINRLAFFFASPVGVEALQGMINLAIILTEIFGGLIVIFSTIFAAFQFASEAIRAFFTWVGDTVIPFIENLDAEVAEFLEKMVFGFKMMVSEFASWVAGIFARVVQWFVDLWNGAKRVWNDFIGWIKGIPQKILDALGNLGNLLLEAGRSIMRGFWEGLKQIWEDIKAFFSGIGDWIAEHKGPLDYDRKLLIPAGEAIMGGLAKGMRSQIPEVLGLAAGLTETLHDIYRMPGVAVPDMDPMNLSATQINNLNMGGVRFDGTPSETQARTAGRAVAGGMMAQIQQQQIRVAVRSA